MMNPRLAFENVTFVNPHATIASCCDADGRLSDHKVWDYGVVRANWQTVWDSNGNRIADWEATSAYQVEGDPVHDHEIRVKASFLHP